MNNFRRDSKLQIASTRKLLMERLDNGDLSILSAQTGIDQTCLMDWYEDATLVPSDDQLEALTLYLAAAHYRSEADKLSLLREHDGRDPYNSHRWRDTT